MSQTDEEKMEKRNNGKEENCQTRNASELLEKIGFFVSVSYQSLWVIYGQNYVCICVCVCE